MANEMQSILSTKRYDSLYTSLPMYIVHITVLESKRNIWQMVAGTLRWLEMSNVSWWKIDNQMQMDGNKERFKMLLIQTVYRLLSLFLSLCLVLNFIARLDCCLIWNRLILRQNERLPCLHLSCKWFICTHMHVRATKITPSKPHDP